MLSISTSWMSGSKANCREWLSEVKELGFDAVELSYKVGRAQLAEIELLLKEFDLKVSSIHNFCPTPDDAPSPRHPSNHYRLSALDETERQSAVKWTKTAVDTAMRVGAGVVVIHAGVVDVEDERSPKLFELFTSGQADSDEFKQEQKRILILRKEKRGPYLDQLQQSLQEVLAYTEGKSVKIGLETRYYPLEIPNFDEVGFFLKHFGKQGLGYWHDVGHAQMNDNLGICKHEDFLKSYQEQLIGVHLHGIEGRRDHLAPFEGDMDLDALLPYFGDEVIRVVESKPFADRELIQKAVEKLK